MFDSNGLSDTFNTSDDWEYITSVDSVNTYSKFRHFVETLDYETNIQLVSEEDVWLLSSMTFNPVFKLLFLGITHKLILNSAKLLSIGEGIGKLANIQVNSMYLSR